jgi:hypothetical protein
VEGIVGACSDGINFWVPMDLGTTTPDKLLSLREQREHYDQGDLM